MAIGKEGQNARLAAKLTGYKIDIKAASAVHEWEEEDAAEAERLAKEAEEMAEAGLDKAPADEVDALDDVQADELEPAEEGSAEDEAAEE